MGRRNDDSKEKAKPVEEKGDRAQQTEGTQYELNAQEFGPLESKKHLYIQRHPPGKELPPVEEDLPSLFVYISTYISYLVLIIIGHIRDFFGRLLNDPAAMDLKEVDGYAPLFSDFDSFYTRRLKHRLTDCFNRPTTGVPGRFITVKDRYSLDYNDTFIYPGTSRQCLNLSSYNYLGFAQSKGQCTDAAEKSIKENGIHSGGPRAVSGTLDMHRETEDIMADFVGKEACTIYSMGYATNANVFASLVDKHCLVISDELNHASIRFGVRVSKAVIKIFKHNDMEDLEKLLREQISQGQPRTHRPWKKIMIVVEGLYSMEGTMCNLPRLIELKKRYKFHLFVDEAHSIGAMGPHGRGVCDYFSIDPKHVDVLMGTFTKSFGATGGYIAADQDTIDHLRVRNMGDVYAESMSPPVLAQIQSSLKTIRGDVRPGEGEERLRRLAFNSRYLRLGLRRMGFIVSGIEDSPIIPLMLYQPAKMPASSRAMLARNIAVVVVGYPATPLASSRMRLCVSAALTKSDMDTLLRVFAEEEEWLEMRISQEKGKFSGKRLRWPVEDVIASLEDDVHKDWSQLD
ncbi:hypothetical protein TRICI_000651 [Trichomonascus ciferrii]|uniref:serine C-palmitoyltransferase n=1 Tax=Trichomonascus ciferrii TaxID=44093 RepID=A0A642VAQ8_9ASCO|nr:hypothetical protein TRICI_000651 [Trichomonascus ciferrii]